MSYEITLWTEPKQAPYEDAIIGPEVRHKSGLEEVTLERQFLRPYREGRDIILEG